MNKVDEALLILSEECAEVVQAISKCQRFGIDNYKPGKPKSNRAHLEDELGDLLAMIIVLEELEVIDRTLVERASIEKRNKLRQWSTLFTDQ